MRDHDLPDPQGARRHAVPQSAGRLTLGVDVGWASARGRRPENEDYAACWTGDAGRRSAFGVIAAMADGVGGSRGGRVAAELTVRSLIDGLLGQSEARPVRHSAAVALTAVNSWLHAVGRRDEALSAMACTLTAVVVRGRRLHVLHVGDTRLYRLRDGELELLTTDHVQGRPGVSHALTRAVGTEPDLRLDYAEHACRTNDRLLLLTDGVHGALPLREIAALLNRRETSTATATRIVERAEAASGDDNATALVLDLIDLPAPEIADVETALAALPIGKPPQAGATVDEYNLERMIADGRYSRVFAARDMRDGRAVVLKFPKAGAAEERSFRQAFLREGWIAARVRSPFVGEMIEPEPGRGTQLYAVLPFYGGDTLERRLLRPPPVSLSKGLAIAASLCKALAALHRAGVIHRDVKPENVMLTARGATLIDLGVARLPELDDFAPGDRPGTPSYMAPELFAGQPGDARSDLYALGVTLWRMWSGGAYPYGEVQAFSRPVFGIPAPLSRRRPDLPSWLEQALRRAVAVNPDERQADVLELAMELETGMATGTPLLRPDRSLHGRDPLRFWRATAALLFLLLLLSLSGR